MINDLPLSASERPSRSALLTADIDVRLRHARAEVERLATARQALLGTLGKPDLAWWVHGALVLDHEQDQARLDVIRRLVRDGDASIRIPADGSDEYFTVDFDVQAPDDSSALAIVKGLIRHAGGDPDSGRGGCCGNDHWTLYGAYPAGGEHQVAHAEGTTRLEGEPALEAIERISRPYESVEDDMDEDPLADLDLTGYSIGFGSSN